MERPRENRDTQRQICGGSEIGRQRHFERVRDGERHRETETQRQRHQEAKGKTGKRRGSEIVRDPEIQQIIARHGWYGSLKVTAPGLISAPVPFSCGS